MPPLPPPVSADKVTVPIEPTDEIMERMYKAWLGGGKFVYNTYKAAIGGQRDEH